MSDFGMPYLMECGTVESCAAFCHELGLDFVELNISFPTCRLRDLTPERLRGLTEAHGVYFTLHMDEEANPFAFNELVREGWMETFRRAIALCRASGIPVLNMHMPKGIYITLDGVRNYMYERYREDYLRMVRAFRDECAGLLAGSGTVICVENTSGWLPFEQAAIDLLLEAPCFALTMDIGHDHAAGHADWPFIRARLDCLAHMHAHDCAGKRDHLSLGRGEIDLRQRLGLAVANDARILVEVKTVASLRESVAGLRSYLPRTADMADVMVSRPVRVTVDRPLGSRHPRHPDMLYTVNYGYVKGIVAPDGDWQDAYILGIDEPVAGFMGRIIAVIHREDDVEEKWVVAPEGVTFTAEEILRQVWFVEQYFRASVRMV